MSISALLMSAGLAAATLDPKSTEIFREKLFRRVTYGLDNAALLYRIEVSPEGRMLSCAAEDKFGDKLLLARFCRFAKTLRYVPGSAPDGTKVHGVIRGYVGNRLFSLVRSKEPPHMVPQPDVELSVSTPLPESNATLHLGAAVYVDASGKGVACKVGKGRNPFGDAACEYALKKEWPIFRDERGLAVPFTAVTHVRFIGPAPEIDGQR